MVVGVDLNRIKLINSSTRFLKYLRIELTLVLMIFTGYYLQHFENLWNENVLEVAWIKVMEQQIIELKKEVEILKEQNNN